MTRKEHRIDGDLERVMLAALERTFTSAGGEAHYPGDDEIELEGDFYSVNIYRTTNKERETFLLGGEILCPSSDLDTTVAKFAKLLERSGAIYNLEYRIVPSAPTRSLVHPAFLPAKDGDWVFELGSEYAPDAAFGLDRLTVREDGSFEYENRMRGLCSRSERGRLDGALVDTLRSALAESGFPAKPEQPSPPGSGYLIIKRPAADEAVAINVFAAPELAGYDTVVSTLTRWTHALRAQPGTPELPAGIALDRDDPARS